MRNQADTLIYSTEKSLKDLEGKLPGDEKQRVEDALAELRSVMDSDDLDDVNAKINALKDTMYSATSKMYKDDDGNNTQSSSSESSSSEEDDNVVDADYEEVK